jgi:methylenetetrahydrofolate reductase (NADPH)
VTLATVRDRSIDDQPALARLLSRPRYEVIPVRGIEEKVAALPLGSSVAVTASPAHGVGRTVDVAEALAWRGYEVVPHLAARMIEGRGELEEIVGRYAAAGVTESFVIGGDASPPAGRYAAAADLLDELADLDHPFARIGIGGYPEGHPLIADERLLEALRRKQPHADHIVTQLCFDAETLVRWIGSLRDAGLELPVTVGLPGAVERGKLAEISLKTGVGASLRYLRKHRREMFALARSRHCDPTPLADAIAAHLDDPGLGIAGAHLFTFNQVEETRAWVRRVAAEHVAA